MARHPRLIVLTALLVLGSAAPSLAQDRDRPAVRREVEGRDRRGREVEISINRDGRVTRVERSQSDDG